MVNGSQVVGKQFVVFDIDGTIFRWQLYHELFDAFIDEKIITTEKAKPVITARDAWRDRHGDYVSYERELVHAMQEAIVGIDEHHFNTIADTILKSKGHHVYRYTLDLLNKLKSQGYTIIAISGSHQQLVDRFAKLHGIDICVGRNHTIKNGKLTNIAAEIFGNKDTILSKIVEEYDLTWEGSYAVGDSGGDIDMLQLVENPLAFNPDAALKEKALKEGWTIVIERKSISYKLQRGSDGSYVLA